MIGTAKLATIICTASIAGMNSAKKKYWKQASQDTLFLSEVL